MPSIWDKAGLGLPDRDYYLEAGIFAAEKASLSGLCRAASHACCIGPNADAAAPSTSSISRPRSPRQAGRKCRSATRTRCINPMTVAELEKSRAGLRLEALLRGDANLGARARDRRGARTRPFRNSRPSMRPRRSTRCRLGRPSISRTTPRPISRNPSRTPISTCTTRRSPASSSSACAGNARSRRWAAAISAPAAASACSARWVGASGQLYTAQIFRTGRESENRSARAQSAGRLSCAPEQARLDGPGHQSRSASRSWTPTRSRSAIPTIRATIRSS